MASLAARQRQARRLLKLDERGWTDSQGYRRVYLGGKGTHLHRLVMATLVGRPLRTDEHVHHLDGNGTNNRPANLQLLSASAHMSLSNRLYPLVSFCVACGQPFLTRGSCGGLKRFCSSRCANRRRRRRSRA